LKDVVANPETSIQENAKKSKQVPENLLGFKVGGDVEQSSGT